MNTISAIPAAPVPVLGAGGTVPAAATSGSAAGAFHGLLDGLMAVLQSGGVTASTASSDTAGEADAGTEGAEVDVATTSAMLPMASLAMPQAAPVIVDAGEAAVPAVVTTALPVAAMATESAGQPVDAMAGLPAASTDDSAFGEVVLPNDTTVGAPGSSAAAPAAPSLESMIRATAASIGQATERAFAGKRLDGPAVAGVQEGSALQAIDGDAADVELEGFARVAVNAADDAANQQAMGDSSSDLSNGEKVTPGESGSKPLEGFKTMLGSESRPEFSVVGNSSQAKSAGEIALNASRNAIPASVSVRDVGDVVVRSVHYLSGKTEEVVTVRLVPRSLGELQIAVRNAGGGIEVVMTAANAAARDALEGHVAGLREALSREGVDAPRVTIQVAAHFDASHQPSLGQQGSHDPAGHAPRHAPSAYREQPGAAPQDQERQQPRRQRHDGRLNMWA